MPTKSQVSRLKLMAAYRNHLYNGRKATRVVPCRKKENARRHCRGRARANHLKSE